MTRDALTDMAENGCTLHELMAVGGHLTEKEVIRYTRMADRARNAKSAMAKMGTAGAAGSV